MSKLLLDEIIKRDIDLSLHSDTTLSMVKKKDNSTGL